MKPDTLNATPIAAITRATPVRARAGTPQDGVARETPHMRTATNTAITGGGILSSSIRRFTLIEPNDEVERRGGALSINEAALSRSSIPLLGLTKTRPAIARTDR